MTKTQGPCPNYTRGLFFQIESRPQIPVDMNLWGGGELHSTPSSPHASWMHRLSLCPKTSHCPSPAASLCPLWSPTPGEPWEAQSTRILGARLLPSRAPSCLELPLSPWRNHCGGRGGQGRPWDGVDLGRTAMAPASARLLRALLLVPCHLKQKRLAYS